MKNIYISILLFVTILSFSCVKKTKTQREIDKLLLEYEKAVQATETFVNDLMQKSYENIKTDDIEKLLELYEKIEKTFGQLESFDKLDFTEEQKENFEIIKKRMLKLEEEVS